MATGMCTEFYYFLIAIYCAGGTYSTTLTLAGGFMGHSIRVYIIILFLSQNALGRIFFKNLTPLNERFFVVWYTADKRLIKEQEYRMLHGYSMPIDPPSDARFFMIYSLDISNNRLTADMIRLLDGKEYRIKKGENRLLLWDIPQVVY
jgi:hypothetical protein